MALDLARGRTDGHTIAQLEEARDYAALVVTRHGPAYLPIFVRLEAEIAALRSRESALDRAHAIAARRAICPRA